MGNFETWNWDGLLLYRNVTTKELQWKNVDRRRCRFLIIQVVNNRMDCQFPCFLKTNDHPKISINSNLLRKSIRSIHVYIDDTETFNRVYFLCMSLAWATRWVLFTKCSRNYICLIFFFIEKSDRENKTCAILW